MTGRPSKLTNEVRQKAEDYLNGEWKDEDAVPSSVGLAKFLQISKSTIYKWAGEDPSFSDTLSDIQSEQERILVNMGLKGLYNSTITKLMLHNHGHSDKADNTLSGPDGGPIETAQTIIFEPVSNGSD